MKMKKLLLLATLGLFVLSPAAEACSSIAVGKGLPPPALIFSPARKIIFLPPERGWQSTLPVNMRRAKNSGAPKAITFTL